MRSSIASRRLLGIAMMALWSLSLFLPAVELCAVHPQSDPATFSRNGLWFLLGGPAALMEGAVGWLANPLILIASVLLIERRQPWLVLSVACLALALLGWWQSYRIFNFDGGPYANCGAAPGLWLWVAASILPLVQSCLERMEARQDPPLQDPD